ncbi:Glycyl-glycine endopeptidase LytM precursor [Caulifigura coniformis]|uniref:Glycyl-glycine endopeptidase LytM n=1 Tax=Caulifigura coniformis TaxID=2527983 RepID=A0A517SAD3_9PLAN|nr:M23 family metallopeptidase [Caulifigura coniformis]QDT53087.1 Glycyl-glycine endopeptidase LytM precursor [Caulifigura coniformis]
MSSDDVGGRLATGWSNLVIVKSGDLDHYDFHLKKDSVTVGYGDVVTEGMELGRVGNTGASSAPHLHFGVHAIDPAGVLRPVAISIRDDLQVPMNDHAIEVT